MLEEVVGKSSDTLSEGPLELEPEADEAGENPLGAPPEDKPAQADDKQEEQGQPPKLILGRYRSEEEAERGHNELRAFSTRQSQELSGLKQQLATILSTQQRGEAIDGATLASAIANDMGDVAIKKLIQQVVAERDTQLSAVQRLEQDAWRERRNVEWDSLLEDDPDAAQFAAQVIEQAVSNPTKPLAQIVIRLRREAGVTNQEAEKTGARKVLDALDANNRRTAPVDVGGGRAQASRSTRFTRAELAIQREFGMSPEEYAKWSTKK